MEMVKENKVGVKNGIVFSAGTLKKCLNLVQNSCFLYMAQVQLDPVSKEKPKETRERASQGTE